jgi:PAS domain S-box-containing protein
VNVHDPIKPGAVPDEIFSGFIRRTPDFAIFAMDPNGIVSSWNPGAERIKGYRSDEIVGRHFSVFYPPSDVAAHRPQYVLQRARSEGRFEDEGWRVRKDGTMFWASVVVTAVHADDGSLRGFVKVTRDLTARRHAEEAIRQSEERYRLLVEGVRDYAIFVLDPDGRVMSWNPGARRLKGYEAEEIIGRHVRTFYEPADQERKHPEDELRVALAEGRYAEEGWRVRKDGTRFWASVTITPIFDREKRHVGFAKVTRDLTERKRADEEIKARAESYERLNRELDAFSHTVAHDLRSPIRAVEHLSSVLLEEERARLSPEGKETLAAMHQSALNMARLVQDLLDLSTAEGREPSRKDVDVTLLVRDVIREQRKLDPKREIDFRVEEGMRASADGHLLRIAFTNLVANAIKFTRRSPHARVEVGREQTERGPAFFVRDNGVGFDPAEAPRLFQPFSRIKPASEFEGTGIGLATVARVARRHGGEVWAEGKPGQGATFYLTIPDPVKP